MKILPLRRIEIIPAGFFGFAVILSAFLVMALPGLGETGEGPGNLGVSLADGEVILYWDAPAADAESVMGYELVRSAYGAEQNPPVHPDDVITPSTSRAPSGSLNPMTSYTDFTATAAYRTYVYRVRVLYGDRKSNWSDYVAVRQSSAQNITSTSTPEPPPAPKNLQGSVDNGTILLVWEAPDNGSVTGYRILRGRNDTGDSSLKAYVENTRNAATVYNDRGVEAGVRYTYRVKAIAAGGLGEWSNQVNVSLAPEHNETEDSFTPDPALYVPVTLPVHMASVNWYYDLDRHFNELIVNFTIHKNIPSNPSGESGLYLMLGYSNLREIPFYFGLQTDVLNPNPPYPPSEKGLIFSRWQTRNLSNAKVADGGWSQSSGHEGDFIGIRFPYEWGAGNYSMRISPDDGGEGEDGWYGMWITDLSTGITTWAGSLKFPPPDDSPPNRVRVYSTIEIYGGPRIKPVDIPEWHVSLKRPSINGVRASSGRILYDGVVREVLNSDASYDRAGDAIHLRAGGFTNRTTPAGRVVFS